MPFSLPIMPRLWPARGRCCAWVIATASASAASGEAICASRQQHLHHHRDLRLFGMADADDRLLDQIGGVFGDRQAEQRRRGERDAARLTELQRRLRIAIDEGLLDRRLAGRSPRSTRRGRDESAPAARRAAGRRRVWIEPQAT